LRSTEQALEAIDQKQREAERDAISAMHRHGQMQGEWPASGWNSPSARTSSRRIRKDVENARQRAEGAKSQHAAAALSRVEPMPRACGLRRRSSSFAGPSNRNRMNLPRPRRIRRDE